MTVRKRGRKFAGAIAIILPLALIMLGIAAWRDAGVQPVTDVTVAVPLPGASK